MYLAIPDCPTMRPIYGITGLLSPVCTNILNIQIRQNYKISVFWVTGLKILGEVGTQKSGKKYDFMRFERHLAFQNA